MEKVEIKIPDNLSPEEEVLLISKLLTQKRIRGNAVNKDIKRIGNEVIVKHSQTQVIITRFSKEKVIEMCTCNVCNNLYQSDTAVPFYHNYGGMKKKVNTCSKECATKIVTFLGNRASLKKSQIITKLF